MRNAGFLLFAISFFGILAFPSCSGDSKHPSELASADSLCKVLKTADSLFNSMDSAVVTKSLQQINYSLAYIQQNQKDTIGRAEGKMLLEFYKIKRPLIAYSKQKKEVANNMHQEKEQCENLSHDLKHNTLDTKLDLKTCLQNERSRVAAISSFCSAIAPAVSRSMKNFKDLYPQIETRVNQLKAKGGKEPIGLDKINDSNEDKD